MTGGNRRDRISRAPLIALATTAVVLLASGDASADTYVVTKRGDPAPDACKKRDCSLREAVRAAHERAGADVIELPNARKPYRLRLGGIDEDLGLVGDLDILNDPLVVKHPGKGRATIDAKGIDRVFDVHPGAPATFRKLVITGGKSAGNGGAIRSAANLEVVGSRIAANEAGNEGGGIDIDAGAINVRRSRIVRNSAGSDGGGGIKYDSSAPGSQIVNSTIAGNDGGERGGGIFVSGGDGEVRISRSTIAQNRAFDYGGIIVVNSTVVLVNSTVAANRAIGFAGGISAADAVVTLNAVTVARNVADADDDGDGSAGGLFRFLASRFEVENSLIALNRLGSGQRNDCDGNQPFDSLGHNLVSTLGPGGACEGFGPAAGRASDIVGAGPRIGKLKRNGGPTKTLALRKRSPAINKAKRTTAPNRDQRGKRRGRIKDIGAYERNTGR